MNKRFTLIFQIMCLTVFSIAVNAQVHNFDSLYENDATFRQSFEASSDFKDLFSSDEIMNITIGSDFKNLVKKKGKEEYQPAIFRYQYSDSVLLTREIEIRPRGLSRKNVCFFPPIKLNFPEDEPILNQLKEFNKLKMVLDCKRGEIFEQFLLSEYMAYKLLNILTEYSYRVRLVRVMFLDTSGKYNMDMQYAFLIENKNQMAERLNAIPLEIKGVKDELIEKGSLVNAYLFQYLIGNTDWSIPGDHNMQLIKSKDPVKTKPYVVPFDFDLAGIVDANYAFPREELGISSVRERLYLGKCLTEEDIKQGLEIFLSKKDEIYALYMNSELLDKNTLKKTISYLDEFYSIIDDDNRLASNIIESCR